MIWNGEPEAEIKKIRLIDWPLFITRCLLMASVSFFLLVVFFLAYLLERISGKKGLTLPIVSLWGRICLWLSGVRIVTEGTPMQHGGALVANHVTWQDIFTIRSAAEVYFVAKAEVRNWPVVGFMAKAAGTLFIERRATEAKRQQAALIERLKRGDRLCFFPEGTSTDGLRVINFKSTLFSAFHTPEVMDYAWIQPVSVIYNPPEGYPKSVYGWWGNMHFGAHFMSVISMPERGLAKIVFHEPVQVNTFENRKELAVYCEEIVRAGLEAGLEGN